MFHTNRDIRQEIDQTLDRLIENERVLKEIAGNETLSTELDALKRTQESLLAHLMHMDGLLNKEHVGGKPLLTRTIAKKLARPNGFSTKMKNKPKIHKARSPTNSGKERE